MQLIKRLPNLANKMHLIAQKLLLVQLINIADKKSKDT